MSSLAKDRVNINDCLISYSVNLEANKMFFGLLEVSHKHHGTFFIFIDHMTVTVYGGVRNEETMNFS